MARTKKVNVAGKFGARYGSTVKEKYIAVVSQKVKKQKCPYCKKYSVKRLAKGLWLCKSCNKKFAAQAHYLN